MRVFPGSSSLRKAPLLPAAVTLAVVGLLAFSRSAGASATPEQDKKDKTEPQPIPPPTPPLPIPVPPPVPDMSKWPDEQVLSEVKRIVLADSSGELRASDAPYVCTLSRRTSSVILPFGSQLVVAERLRSISVKLGGDCGILG